MQRLTELQGDSTLKRTPRESFSERNAPKKALRIKPPAPSELYTTRDFAHYRNFVSRQEATAKANMWDEDDKLRATVPYLDGTLQELWEVYRYEEHREETWENLYTFLESRLGDPKNRLTEAWDRLLHARPYRDKDDNDYLTRYSRLKREVGEEANNLEAIFLYLFHAS